MDERVQQLGSDDVVGDPAPHHLLPHAVADVQFAARNAQQQVEPLHLGKGNQRVGTAHDHHAASSSARVTAS